MSARPQARPVSVLDVSRGSDGELYATVCYSDGLCQGNPISTVPRPLIEAWLRRNDPRRMRPADLGDLVSDLQAAGGGRLNQFFRDFQALSQRLARQRAAAERLAANPLLRAVPFMGTAVRGLVARIDSRLRDIQSISEWLRAFDNAYFGGGHLGDLGVVPLLPVLIIGGVVVAGLGTLGGYLTRWATEAEATDKLLAAAMGTQHDPVAAEQIARVMIARTQADAQGRVAEADSEAAQAAAKGPDKGFFGELGSKIGVVLGVGAAAGVVYLAWRYRDQLFPAPKRRRRR